MGLLFLWGGGYKLVVPTSALDQSGLPVSGLFLKFIGLFELLGGVGLILPALLRIRPSLTPLAAVLLAIIMVGAVVLNLMSMPAAMAVFPFIALILLLFVAYGRTKLAPISPR